MRKAVSATLRFYRGEKKFAETGMPVSVAPAPMLINSLSFRTGGRCTLTHEQTDGWLRATWSGHITLNDAMQGATNYLAQAGPFHNLYLLNDNTSLRGPWFDSIAWLDRVWLPQAIRLGLRYIAHVVQADTHSDILTLNCPAHITNVLELQLFDDVASAQEWLRACQQPLAAQAWAASPRKP